MAAVLRSCRLSEGTGVPVDNIREEFGGEPVAAFSMSHPAVPALYIVLTLGLTMFSMQPVLIALSLAGGLAYGFATRGAARTLGALRWQLPVEREALTEMSHLLNTHFTGLGPEEMNARLMSLSDQVSGKWFLLLNQVCEYAGQLLKDAAGQEVYLGGTTQLLKFPEYRDADKARDLMTFMVDNKQNLPVPSGNAPVQILIGPENVDAALKESSVVIASYDIGDGMRGLVGVVGPTRMDYASVAARLTCFAESLSHMFEKRQLPPTKEEQS